MTQWVCDDNDGGGVDREDSEDSEDSGDSDDGDDDDDDGVNFTPAAIDIS